jgi:hypothetical protein
VQLANRAERAPGAVVIASAALGHDVDIYGTRDRLVRATRLVLVDHRRPGRLTPIRRSKRLIAVVIGREVQTSTFILPG